MLGGRGRAWPGADATAKLGASVDNEPSMGRVMAGCARCNSSDRSSRRQCARAVATFTAGSVPVKTELLVSYIQRRGVRRYSPLGDRRGLHARDPASVRQAIGGREFDAVVDWVALTPGQVRADIGAGRTGQYVFISSASAYQTRRPGCRS